MNATAAARPALTPETHEDARRRNETPSAVPTPTEGSDSASTGRGAAPKPSPTDLIALYERERRDPTPPAAVRDLFADPWGLRIDYLAVILMASWARGAGPNGWPLIALPRAEWVAMFESVGYLHNGFRAEAHRPREPITLYRGATPAYRDGLSWTTREADARFYAGRHPDGRMYTLDADPAWLLARITGNVFAPGGEYVVNAPADAIREIGATAPEPEHGTITAADLERARAALRDQSEERP